MESSDKKRRPMQEGLSILGEEARSFVKGDAQPISSRPPSSEPPDPSLGTLSVSVRLPAQLARALARTASLRKLRNERPFSQQEIVSQALAQWLAQHGLEL